LAARKKVVQMSSQPGKESWEKDLRIVLMRQANLPRRASISRGTGKKRTKGMRDRGERTKKGGTRNSYTDGRDTLRFVKMVRGIYERGSDHSWEIGEEPKILP